jgi:4'-phosphopantetheinyl transferase
MPPESRTIEIHTAAEHEPASLAGLVDDGDVHLWIAVDDGQQRDFTATCREVMSPEERRRELDFRYERDRRLYRVARGLTRTVLSLYADVDPRDWTFVRDPAGRPRIAPPTDSALEFSLSHTPGIVLLLVGSRCALGVDVESAERGIDVDAAMSLLAAGELADLRTRSGGSRRRRFLEYWTLKEAYAKACSAGLSLPLNRCDFRIDSDGVAVTMDPALEADPGRWWFAVVPPNPSFIAAVAISPEKRGSIPKLEIHSAAEI